MSDDQPRLRGERNEHLLAAVESGRGMAKRTFRLDGLHRHDIYECLCSYILLLNHLIEGVPDPDRRRLLDQRRRLHDLLDLFTER